MLLAFRLLNIFQKYGKSAYLNRAFLWELGIYCLFTQPLRSATVILVYLENRCCGQLADRHKQTASKGRERAN